MVAVCEVCKEATTKSCGRCKSVYYCSHDHQKAHWKQHKKTCLENRKNSVLVTTIDSSSGKIHSVTPNNVSASQAYVLGNCHGMPMYAGSWFDHIAPADHYEWLTNCYQLRCDDDYAWGGCYLHGPYDPDADVNSITEDFLCFCLLAKRNNMLPQNWNWSAFLKAAGKWAGFAFEKSDAIDRWGAMAGWALRYAAERIYGYNPFGQSPRIPGDSDCHDTALEHASAPISRNRYVAEVGGKAAWNEFKNVLRASRRNVEF